MDIRKRLARLVVREDGAVTTSWTMLSAGVVGLAAAVLSIFSMAMNDVGSDVRTAMQNQIRDTVAGAALMAYDFADGFGDWTAAVESHADPLISGALGPFYDQSGDEVLSQTFSFPPGTEYAVFEFDMTAIGRMEGHDDFRVFVDGEMVDATSIRDGRIDGVEVNDNGAARVAYQFVGQEWISDNAAIQQRIATANTTVDNGATTRRAAIGSNVDRESTYRMQVVVRDPGQEMQLGFGRGGNSPYPGEAWSIDNMTVEAAGSAPEQPSG
jgi:hypothetical protein